jgi:hypothetical protein
MNAEELKHKIKEIFGNQIVFNKEFDKLADDIKSPEDLFSWCVLIKERKIPPISNAETGDKIIFIKKIGSSNRCIIIKIKNGEFKEVHLGDHRYYNYLTGALGIKKSSETY